VRKQRAGSAVIRRRPAENADCRKGGGAAHSAQALLFERLDRRETLARRVRLLHGGGADGIRSFGIRSFGIRSFDSRLAVARPERRLTQVVLPSRAVRQRSQRVCQALAADGAP
jgi:hypothetical protein